MNAEYDQSRRTNRCRQQALRFQFWTAREIRCSPASSWRRLPRLCLSLDVSWQMKRFPKFLLSLIVQCLLLILAMCILDSGHSAILLALLCSLWNLVLISDWALCKTRLLRHGALMEALPAAVLFVLPVVFFGIALGVRW